MWTVTGFASGSILSRRGGPTIMGRGWCVQTLNVEALNVDLKCCSSALLFSSVAGTGRGIGPVGGSERVGHPHVRFSAEGEVLVWSGRCSRDGPLTVPFPEGGEGVLCGEHCPGSGMLDAAAAVVVDGNWGGINPRSEHVSLLKNNLVTLGVTYTICLDLALVSGSEISTMMAPRKCIPLLFAACIRWETGIRFVRDNPSCLRMCVPARQH